jgi:subtilisin family serine protease
LKICAIEQTWLKRSLNFEVMKNATNTTNQKLSHDISCGRIITYCALLFTFIFLVNDSKAQDFENTKIWVTADESVQFVDNWKSDLISSNNPDVISFLQDYNVNEVTRALSSSRSEQLKNVYEIECSCDKDAFLKALNHNNVGFSDAVEAPNYEVLGQLPDDYTLEFAPDYALDLINAEEAWEYSIGDTSVVLGISDAGYYESHEDLQGEFVSLVNGTSTQQYYHGTAVAVAAAGATNNGVGKSAIGYDCKLALNTIGYNQLLALSYGGAKVINVSWTSGCSENLYVQSVIDEVNANGTIIVAAAGNGSTCNDPNAYVYPASCDGVISVTSVGPYDNHERTIGDSTTTHQHNDMVDISAPGYDVGLTVGLGNYMTGNGTSFAAPYVTGTIGLMLSLKPCLTYDDVLSILQATAKNIDNLNTPYNGLIGAGRLDAGAALEYVAQMNCISPTLPIRNYTIADTLTVSGGIGVITANNPTPTVVSDSIKIKWKGDAVDLGQQNSRQTTNNTEIQENIQANVYPNPTSGSATINWQGLDVRQIIITDSFGRLVDFIEIKEYETEKGFKLETEGLYFIKLLDANDRALIKKLIVRGN